MQFEVLYLYVIVLFIGVAGETWVKSLLFQEKGMLSH
jgi:hypothetical protein